MSPPWGGPEYQNYTVLDMRSMSVDGAACLKVALGVTPNVACFLPKNVNVAQVPHQKEDLDAPGDCFWRIRKGGRGNAILIQRRFGIFGV
jgi:hypothetical protein